MMKKIALEEHCMFPQAIEYWKETSANISPELFERALRALSDFGDRRLEIMDKNGVEFAVLSLSGPGVQAERETKTAVRVARELNDLLAVEVQKKPGRYGGLGHVAVQDPVAAADELDRCMNDLGFQGVMINGQTNGVYLDDDRVSPLWERAAAVGAPIYIHPNNPPDRPYMYAGHPELWGPLWSWGVETANHALRLVFAGVFDRYPGARLMLGHMGEALPFQFARLDSRWKVVNKVRDLNKQPSEYFRTNISVTTSGVFSLEPLLCATSAMGEDNVMFSVDYPFEHAPEACEFIDNAPIGEDLRAKICYRNAQSKLKLPAELSAPGRLA
ncbi:MAG TPA: amidohydrolase family protein [Patescibacteria group bacterium]|nr:amidohydrolase family protein [Patescibacteria group bacterium]